MRGRAVRLDLELAKEGVLLGWYFGARSVSELVRIANYIQTSVYDRGSLRKRPDGFEFRLANPPLRLGAFHRAFLHVDGAPVPGERVRVRVQGAVEFRSLASLSPDRPLPLLPGRSAEFRVESDPPPARGRTLEIRIDLFNVAIPPPVWIQFRDRVGRGAAG